MVDGLNKESLKSFFSEFLEQYVHEVENKFSNKKEHFTLFNSRPIKVDLLLDKNMLYGVILLSKNTRPEFKIDNTFQDPMMVIAAANSKKYEYGEQGAFLYLFQVNQKRFITWNVQTFVEDFINYELSKNNFR